MPRPLPRFSEWVRRLWNGRRTYSNELERERNYWRQKCERLEMVLDSLQAERVDDAKRVADAFAVAATRKPVHKEIEPAGEIEPMFETPEMVIENARASRRAKRQAYADAHGFTLEEVNDLIRRRELTTDSIS